jgi:predicted enzyme related to lactoylglutathione lyase
MPVTGIGGFFFRSDDPDALGAWYQQRFGICPADFGWQQAAGPTVVAPFSRTSDHFSLEKQWMLNLRVAELDAVLHDLEAAGIAIVRDPAWDTPETGRFARVHDPEGNPIELWEPPPD